VLHTLKIKEYWARALTLVGKNQAWKAFKKRLSTRKSYAAGYASVMQAAMQRLKERQPIESLACLAGAARL